MHLSKKSSSRSNSLKLFSKAFANTKQQMWVSLKILGYTSLLFSAVLYFAEHVVNPGFSFLDSLLWMFVKFVQDPAGIMEPPVTLLGQIIGTLSGVVTVAIIAIPAGLVGSGLIDAMADERREQELEECHERMLMAFRRESNATFREYLNSLPDKGGERLKKLNFVPSRVSVDKLRARQHLDIEDIIDVVKKYPEFELKTMATAMSDDDNPNDRLVVEHFPLNRDYGCCINRNSKVTIINANGYIGLGISQFSYYLAKFGGFNYISKNVEVDCDEQDSFFNMSKEVEYKFKADTYYKDVKDEELKKAADEKIGKKKAVRNKFFNDVKECLSVSDDPWVIVLNWHIKNSNNTVDVQIECNNKNGDKPTVVDTATFGLLTQAISTTLQENVGLTTDVDNPRYPLMVNNLLYRLKKPSSVGYDRTFNEFNGFVLRPSSELLCFDNNRTKVAYLLAETIRKALDAGDGIRESELSEFERGFGYSIENEIV